MDGISVLRDAGKWVAASVPSVLYVLLNGLTVTQFNTFETDGYLGGKGQRQSFTPFYLPLCHVVLFSKPDMLAATTQRRIQ